MLFVIENNMQKTETNIVTALLALYFETNSNNKHTYTHMHIYKCVSVYMLLLQS